MSKVIPFPTPDRMLGPPASLPEANAALDVLLERCRLKEGGGAPGADAGLREIMVHMAARAILWVETYDRNASIDTQ